MVISARSRAHLFLSLLVACFSDPRSDWPAGNSLRTNIWTRSRIRRPGARIVVCANIVLVLRWNPHDGRGVLGWNGCVPAIGCQLLATRDVGGLFHLAFFPSSALRRIFPAISLTECCSKPASSRSFFAPPGVRPGWGLASPPSRASIFLLQWEWFRIYFESGVAKLAGGDPEWRNFTAMDNYYQDGPLPTWIGWVCSAFAALVSRRDGLCDAGA